jgi:uncharacterized membrane protein HdeD (DUF308 family)
MADTATAGGGPRAAADFDRRDFDGDLTRRDDLLRRNWGWLVARGALLILLGVLALLSPSAALFAFAIVFAAFSFVDGVFGVISAIRGARDKSEHWGALLFSGIVGIAIGVLFILFPLVSTFAFAWVAVVLLAAWAVLSGVLEISAAIRLRREIKGEWLLALAGTLSVILGLALATMLAVMPGVTAVSVAWLIGIYALVAGISMVVLGFRLRGHA